MHQPPLDVPDQVEQPHAGASASDTAGASDTAADRVDTERQRTPSGFGVKDWLKWLWAQLTSMRTALALLFLGALAAIPGSFIPQRSISPYEVEQFIADNPSLGNFYDAIGLFAVYTSPWFAAIYLLLLVSLVGCIIPRIGQHYRSVKAQPPKAPKRLQRLPEHDQLDVEVPPEQALARAEQHLRRKRFRVVAREGELSAEKGYLREVGNLVFHISLVLVLATIAIGVLWGFRGTSATIVGRGFSNNLSFYDDVVAGPAFRTDQLQPFTVMVDDFQVEYDLGNPGNESAPRMFQADVTVIDRPGAEPRQESIFVNHPVTVDGVSVHLLGFGFAPVVTVTDGQGEIATSGPVLFLPQDGNFTSAGVIKAPDARPDRLAFQGFFLPTATVDELGPRSLYPDAISPELFLNAWAGPPQPETGIPENVYQLDTTGLEQLRQPDGEPLRIRLAPGESIELPDGQGTLAFDGWTRWVRLQYSSTPASVETLIAIGLAVAGLCLSLFVRPRRIWVKARRDDNGSTLVEVGGLDRVGGRVGLEDELAGVLSVVQDAKENEARPKEEGGETPRSKERA